MKRSITMFTLFLSFVLSGNASACLTPPTLDNVLSDGGGSVLVTNMNLLTDVVESGQNYVALTDLTTPQTAVATLLLEAAGYANQNQLGIYNYNGDGVAPSSSEMLLLFNGSATAPSSATIQFDLNTGTAWYDHNSNGIQDVDETASVGTTFGFYLISPDSALGISNPTFYTDSLLNPDTTAAPHGLIYDIRSITGAIVGDPDVVVAFEDLLACHSDWDFTDMVVGVTDVTPVPEPTTIALLGFGSLTFLRKRRS